MSRNKLLVALLVVLAAAVLLLAGRQAAGYIPAFAARVESLGAAGAAVFVAGYIVATVAMVPGSLLTLAAGAIFGLVEGTLLVLLAATAGATIAFLIARHAVRATVVRRLGDDARFRALDSAIETQGRKIVFLIRLSPLFPFNVTNYALGVTGVRLRDYVIACAGMLPGTLLYVYYGRLIGDVAGVIAGTPVPRDTAYWVVLVLGLVATLVVTTLITRAARRALHVSVDKTHA